MIVGSYPSSNHPVSKGALCVKGWNAYEFVNKLDRLKAPLVKSGSGFKEVSWDEALETVSKKLLGIKEKDLHKWLVLFNQTLNEELKKDLADAWKIKLDGIASHLKALAIDGKSGGLQIKEPATKTNIKD